MKQDKLSEVTRKAIETPLGFTQTLLEKTEKVLTKAGSVWVFRDNYRGQHGVITHRFNEAGDMCPVE